jgi:hypothetical protein
MTVDEAIRKLSNREQAPLGSLTHALLAARSALILAAGPTWPNPESLFYQPGGTGYDALEALGAQLIAIAEQRGL